MECQVAKRSDGQMLSAFLREFVDDVPARVIRDVIRSRGARVDGVRISGDVALRAGQQVTVYWPKAYLQGLQAPEMLPPVIYEDAHILIIDKPAGLLSQSESQASTGNNALDLVRKALQRRDVSTEPVLCHRLDVMTGGLLMFAKDPASAEAGLHAFENRDIDKYYTCDVKGCPARDGVLDAWLRKDERTAQVSVTDYPARGALPIRTGYRVLKGGPYARLEVELFTGRTHQIRAHLAHIGHPILGDDKYGDRSLNRQLGIRHQRLWATRMTFHTNGVLAYLRDKTVETTYPYPMTE